MYKILICDDERDIRNALRIYLTGEGYAVCEADSGLAALELMQREEVQLVLMDIMMPGMDGMTATAKLREQSNVPVILITAKSEDNDKILGLTVGADDYITKPFNPLEVLARVKAQLRRYAQLGGMPEKSTALTLGGIAMDDERKSVTLDGEEVTLTPDGVRHSPSPARKPRQGVFERRYLPARLEGRTVFRGGNGAGAYPPSA